MGVCISDLNTTLQGAFGSKYVNQFTRKGRVKQVYVQGQADSRMLPSDLSRWYARNTSGNMVPFDAFISGKWILGPQKVEGYSGLTSSEILGSPAPGVSTGEAMAAMASLVKKLPQGIGYEWTGLSYEEEKAGSQTGPLYAISLIMILLCLAALSTVGLAVKNAILIVEFAKAFYDSGMPLVEAAIKAAQERLRPILMTSIDFVLGSLPLAVAQEPAVAVVLPSGSRWLAAW